MYNHTEKRTFGCRQNNTKTEEFFEFTEKYETEFGKDLCDFTHDELLQTFKDFYKSASPVRRKDIPFFCRNVQKYQKAMCKFLGTEPVAGSTVYAWEVLGSQATVKDDKTAFFSPEVIRAYSTILSPRDTLALYACYEGFRGEDKLGILTLTHKDIDIDQRRVNLNGDEIPISRDCRATIIDVEAETERQKFIFPRAMSMETVAQAQATMRRVMHDLRGRLGLSNNVLSARNLSTAGLCLDLYSLGYVRYIDNIEGQLSNAKQSNALRQLMRRYDLSIDSRSQWYYVKGYLSSYFGLYFDEIAKCVSDKEFD